MTTRNRSRKNPRRYGRNSYAEMHTTIYSISESPRDGQTIWVGTDDGNLQVTRDGAKSWTNVVGNVPNLPKASWVSWVEASLYDAGTAYATFDRHTSEIWSLTSSRRQTTGRRGRRFSPQTAACAATRMSSRKTRCRPACYSWEPNSVFGFSLDSGKHWAKYKGHEFPSVAVRDIVVHPRESDLVIATHGRGIWIVDDITTLRKLTPEVMAHEAVFLQAKPAQQRLPANGGWVEGSAVFTGPNPPTRR